MRLLILNTFFLVKKNNESRCSDRHDYDTMIAGKTVGDRNVSFLFVLQEGFVFRVFIIYIFK